MPNEAQLVERRPSVALERLDPQQLLSQAIDKGAGLDMMERLLALAQQVREITAREAWYEAMAKFQAECPPIYKNKRARIASARGGFEYTYSSLDQVMATIQPIMGPLGLSVSWKTAEISETRVTVNCRVSHTLGHFEESGPVTIPVPQQGESGATPQQRVGIAMTYAKRISVLGICGKAPEDDPDGDHGEGGGQSAAVDPHQPPANGEQVISQQQLNRLMAIASGSKWSDEQIHKLLAGDPKAGEDWSYTSRKDIKLRDYERICDRLKLRPPPPTQP